MKSVEKLRAEREKNRTLLRLYEGHEKALMKQMKELDRKERSHRLIERGAILEKYLRNPLLLTNDQIVKILGVAFSQKDTEKILFACLTESRKRALEEEGDGQEI